MGWLTTSRCWRLSDRFGTQYGLIAGWRWSRLTAWSWSMRGGYCVSIKPATDYCCCGRVFTSTVWSGRRPVVCEKIKLKINELYIIYNTRVHFSPSYWITYIRRKFLRSLWISSRSDQLSDCKLNFKIWKQNCAYTENFNFRHFINYPLPMSYMQLSISLIFQLLYDSCQYTWPESAPMQGRTSRGVAKTSGWRTCECSTCLSKSIVAVTLTIEALEKPIGSSLIRNCTTELK